MIQTIEIDCAPCTARPDTYIGQVIEGLDLPTREPVKKFFGNWTWDYSDIPATHWVKIKPQLKQRISRLYDLGYIRYGSW